MKKIAQWERWTGEAQAQCCDHFAFATLSPRSIVLVSDGRLGEASLPF
jgi:hypothetical protein